MFDSVHVIINPASGRDRPILSVLNDAFRQREWIGMSR